MGIDPIFYEKMNQWALKIEHKADEQAAELLKKPDLVLANQNETSGSTS
jgi:hypothetical protein